MIASTVHQLRPLHVGSDPLLLGLMVVVFTYAITLLLQNLFRD